ncbi:MAG: MaoC/PaaZ C-terminal domain-containing protein [Salinirussus sp.]
MGGFDDIAIGDRVETQGRTITRADIVNFAGVSGDFNHVHTDAEAMKESQFGEPIAHGALVFSIMTGLLWQSRGDDEQEAVVAFYGVDNLRFVAPCYVGDTIHLEREVIDKEERDHPVASGTVRYQANAVNQDGDVVIAAEFISMLE